MREVINPTQLFKLPYVMLVPHESTENSMNGPMLFFMKSKIIEQS